MKVTIEADLPSDSQNYEVLTEGVGKVVDVPGMTCEIGLRRGGGTKFIIDALVDTKQTKTHVTLDPFGNIEYPEGDDDRIIRCDYTNDMRDECLANLYLYARQKKQSVLFFNLEDTEFFARFGDGVPVYHTTKSLETNYSFVHFDGPHTVRHLKLEIDFFHSRTPTGAVFVFDDVKLYSHDDIDVYLTTLGWEVYRTTDRKWAYCKA